MNKRIRRLSLSMTLALMLMALPGACAQAVETQFPLSQDKVELTVWVALGAPMPEDMDACPQTIWYEEKTNVHVNWVVNSASEVDTKLNLSLASNDYPDIYAVNLTTDQLLMMSGSGVIRPLNELIDQHGYNAKKAFEQYPLYEQYLTAPDGNIYSLFYTDAGQHMLSQNKMFVYKPWLDKAGLDIPETTEEFQQMLAHFRDNDMNENGDASDEIPLVGSFSAWGGDPVGFLMNPFQLYPNDEFLYVNDAGELTFAAVTEGWREGLNYIHQLYEQGLLAEETYVQDATQLRSLVNKADPQKFIAGAVPGAYQMVFADLSVLENGFIDYVAVPPLKGPSGLRQSATSGVGTFYFRGAITSACENPEVAYKWLDYWLSEEGTTLSLWGVEGQDYHLVDQPAINGDARSIERNYTADGFMTFYVNSWSMNTMPMSDWAFNKYRSAATPGVQAYELYAAAKAYEPYYQMTGWSPVRWSADELLVEDIAMLKTPIEDYVSQAYTEFILGKRDLSKDWDAYLADLEKLGLSEYLSLQAETLPR